MKERTATDASATSRTVASMVCMAVSWVPFMCLFAPFGTIAGNGEAWYVPYTSFLYLHAYSLFSPTVSLFGPERLIGAAVLQSVVVMFALQICVRKLIRLVQRSTSLVRRKLERIAASVIRDGDDASRAKCQPASA